MCRFSPKAEAASRTGGPFFATMGSLAAPYSSLDPLAFGGPSTHGRLVKACAIIAAVTITRVAILVIGDEILSGDTQETNSHYMACGLARAGASLRRVLVVPDDVEEIARFAQELAAEHDVVLTSGGIGPTHDDVTMEGIARAFGVSLVAHPELHALVNAWRGEALDEAHLRLTRVPEGASLLWTDKKFPLVQFRNLYILPGVPRLLQRKFDALLPLIQGEPIWQRQLVTDESELSLAEALGAVQSDFPSVVIGSYPFSDGQGHWSVRLVLKARNAEELETACAAVRARIPGTCEKSASACIDMAHQSSSAEKRARSEEK